MATMYATYKDNNNNLNQVSLTTTAKNDLIYSVLDIGGQYGYYAWRDANTTDRIVIKRLNLLTGELYTFTASGNEYITLTGAIDPLMLCLTRDGNKLYIASAGSKDIYSFTTVQGTATPATTITSISTGKFIYAMKINKSGHLTTISKDNIINQFDTANANAQVGTANRDLSTALSTANLGSTYINIPMYFKLVGTTESIRVVLYSTTNKAFCITSINQSTWAVSERSCIYMNSYNPFSSDDNKKFRYGADLIYDVYGMAWLSHTSTNGKSGADTVTGAITSATVKKITNPIAVLYVEWTTTDNITYFTVKETNSSGAVITTYTQEYLEIDTTIKLENQYIDMSIIINNLNSNGTITIGKIDASEVVKIDDTNGVNSFRALYNQNVIYKTSRPCLRVIKYIKNGFAVDYDSYLVLNCSNPGYNFTLKDNAGNTLISGTVADGTNTYSDNGLTVEIIKEAIDVLNADLYIYFQTFDLSTYIGGQFIISQYSKETDANKNFNLINNLGADSTGAIYYSYVADLSQTEVNGKIYRYRSDGGASTVTASNLETYLSRSYCLTNRNDMLAYDLSTDGCAGR